MKFWSQAKHLFGYVPVVGPASRRAYQRISDSYARRTSPGSDQALSMIRQRWEGGIASGSSRTLVLFAHFDRDGVVDDYVVHYLRKLREELSAEIIFVSTSRSLRVDSVEAIRPFVSEVVLRDNRGLDFGSWCTALAMRPQLEGYDRLILANDSVYGPFFDLEPILQKLPADRPAMLGLSDNHELEYHLQSYFLALNRPALASPAWRDFWREFVFFANKKKIIRNYEIGFSGTAAKSGIELVVAYPYKDVVERARASGLSVRAARAIARRKVNSTLFFWRPLIEQLSFPFIKGELLKFNPEKLEDLGEVPSVVGKTGYPFELIRKHLDRMGKLRFY